MKRNNLAPVISLDKLQEKRKKLTDVGLVGGAFDILHIGHIDHLRKAKSFCNTLIVHITGNKRVREKKGKGPPIINEKERAKIISAIRFVDYVFIYNGRHYDQKVIDIIKPDILIFNIKDNHNKKIKKTISSLKNFNGRIIVLPQRKNNSSSQIIKKI